MIEVDESLWKAYREGKPEAYDRLVEAYLPLVKITVGRMAVNFPTFIDYEELYSTGCIGLLSAVERYDPSREAKFTTYAITRIRGAVIDELRTHDVLGRVTRERVTRIHEVENEAKGNGEVLNAEEIAERAGLTLNEYHDARRGDRASRMVSLSEPISGDEGRQSLAEMLESKGLMGQEGLSMEDDEILTVVTNFLEEREKLLVTLYYHEELTLKEIGTIMEVSESRVSQLHSEMVERVRKKLKNIGV